MYLFLLYVLLIGFITAEMLATSAWTYSIHIFTAWFTVPLRIVFEAIADMLARVRTK